MRTFAVHPAAGSLQINHACVTTSTALSLGSTSGTINDFRIDAQEVSEVWV